MKESVVLYIPVYNILWKMESPQLEKLQKNFMQNPPCLEACVKGVKQIRQ